MKKMIRWCCRFRWVVEGKWGERNRFGVLRDDADSGSDQV